MSCQRWREQVTALTRALRVRPAENTPDLVSAVMTDTPRRRRWPRLAVRIALAIVAIGQLCLGVLQAVGFAREGHGATAAHLFNESTAWNIAIGIGLLWSAARNLVPAGVLPMFGGFLLVLIGFSVHDLTVGAVDVGRLASHGFVVLGTGLLYVLRWQQHHDRDPDPEASLETDSSTAGDPLGPSDSRGNDRPRKRRRPLRPTAYRHVA